MGKEKKKCVANLKDGRRCPNTGKPEYNGYCGIHRNKPLLKEPASSSSKGEGLARLVAITSGLIVLAEKAVTYLPQIIEVLVEASKIMFVRPVGEPFPDEWIEQSHASPKGPAEEHLISMSIAPKQIATHLHSLVEDQAWQRLADDLSYDFDLKVTSGSVPEPLLEEIMRVKTAVQKELSAQGYRPSASTAQRPLYIPSKR
jgi:hypothetical protein